MNERAIDWGRLAFDELRLLRRDLGEERVARSTLEERLAALEERLATDEAEIADAHERLDNADRALDGLERGGIAR